jgi:hypothetical protein
MSTKPETMTFDQKRLNEALAKFRSTIKVKCRFLLPFAGGVPASDKALEAFIEHHLHLVPETDAFKETFSRIRHEEIGERDTTPEQGEVSTQTIYAVNIVRSTPDGPFISAHQIKACLKQACSRLGMFNARGKMGSKGDVAELGSVCASGDSIGNPDAPWEIMLRKDGKPAPTHFDLISGTVGTPKGKKSIQHHTQVVEAGSEFEFTISWPSERLSPDDMMLAIAAMTQIGLGSCLSLAYGRFEVIEGKVTHSVAKKPKADNA